MFFSRRSIYLLWVGCCSLLPVWGAAQPVSDTLRVSLPQLEERFLNRNFQLLAQRYQISAAEAEVIQAGLRTNPNLEVATNLYNPNTGKVLPLSTPPVSDINNDVYNSGYYAAELQQLIRLAGKRTKLVALAESNRELASITFRDILRTLRYQLYTSYANLHYDLEAIRLLRGEEERQGRLIESFRLALKTGGVSRYELTRLEVDRRELRTNIATYRSQIAEEQTTLRVLLRQTTPEFILPIQVPDAVPALPTVELSIDSALVNRPDAALAREQINNAERRLNLEQANRTPDLTAGVAYERYGNTYVNFTAIKLSMDLPFFNRNQGGIKVAKLGIKSAQAGLDNQESVVRNEVIEAYEKLTLYYEQNATLPPDYLSQLQDISVEATKAYNNRVISLLDYLDKIRTHQSGILNYIALQNNIFQAQQQLNFTTNTRFF
ncbi:TolC family protein [Spirosoma sp. RP8]|uniref:TolC family protein n=1 Tax=Spirosoma liriopis TaxID=2937440 RepID=A0ABT0HTH6_9BACT|nr:TolC family protein [Spirosoma liriopis]MCK8495471.1 TolC family protein [Spirosoma liriopis]